MFESRSDLKNKLAAAEADVTRLEAELAQSQEQAQLVIEKDQEIASLSAKLLEIKEDHEALKVELELAQSKSSEENIQALVTEEMAKCSHAPVEVAPIESESGEKKVSREEFDAMDHNSRNAFLASGGKLK